jgi:hypothetical protein
LLDGRPATAHWLRFTGLDSRYPQVQWVRGQRVVDDGNVVTTAGILSGVDGTLHVVERLLGADVAADAAAAVGWRHYGTGSPPPVTPSRALPNPVAIVNAGYRWDPPTVGVVLTDGVGEIELASVFDAHAWSLATRTLAVTVDGRPVQSKARAHLPASRRPRELHARARPRARTRHRGSRGRTVVPVPGGPVPEYVHDRRGFAFDATVTDLARSTDVATARWTAKVLELPTEGLDLAGSAWPWAPTALLLVLTLLGAGAVVGTRAALRRRVHDGPASADRPMSGGGLRRSTKSTTSACSNSATTRWSPPSPSTAISDRYGRAGDRGHSRTQPAPLVLASATNSSTCLTTCPPASAQGAGVCPVEFGASGACRAGRVWTRAGRRIRASGCGTVR